MIKLVTLIRRRQDLSMQEFIRRYETGHRRIGEKYLKGYASRYFRRFLLEREDDVGVKPRQYDVLTEIWFPDQEAVNNAFRDLGTPDALAEIAEDEATLFERDSITTYLVEEYESDMETP